MGGNLYSPEGVLTGRQLQDARTAHGWTQARLAEALGMDPERGGKLVSSWEQLPEVPRRREAEIRRVLFPEPDPDQYDAMSDAALLSLLHRVAGIIGQRLASREDVRRQLDAVKTPGEQSLDISGNPLPGPITGRGPRRDT